MEFNDLDIDTDVLKEADEQRRVIRSANPGYDIYLGRRDASKRAGHAYDIYLGERGAPTDSDEDLDSNIEKRPLYLGKRGPLYMGRRATDELDEIKEEKRRPLFLGKRDRERRFVLLGKRDDADSK